MATHPEHALRAAQGYQELGMTDEALRELDSLPVEWQEKAEALEVRLMALMGGHRWKAGLDAALQLCEAAPEQSSGYIHAAFCLHEMGRTDEAREVLLKGPELLRNEAVYHYNLACYEARLGQTESAMRHLELSFRLDRKFREFAKSDPDLTALREKL